MAYITQADLYGELPQAIVTDALDDDRDGAADSAVATLVCDGASEQVDGYLGVRYAVPLATPPALVLRAAKVFALETLYRRREIKDFPLAGEAKQLRERLQLIATGELPLDAGTAQVSSPGALIASDLDTAGSSR